MKKWVYISADYDENSGDQDVIKQLKKWSNDDRFKVTFTDTAQVASGSVSKDSDCRACDLKEEFNKQINASSSVIIIIGDRTRFRTAGDICHGQPMVSQLASVHHIKDTHASYVKYLCAHPQMVMT